LHFDILADFLIGIVPLAPQYRMFPSFFPYFVEHRTLLFRNYFGTGLIIVQLKRHLYEQ